MRGTIIHWDPAAGNGIISDPTGQRHQFGRGDWRSPEEPMAGREVDFVIEDGRPTAIFMLTVLGSAASPFPYAQSEAARQATNYAIISLVCGGVGFMLWPLGLLAAIPAIMFGVKGKRAGQNLTDRSPYIMSIAGIVLGAIVGLLGLLFILFITAVLTTTFWSGAR